MPSVSTSMTCAPRAFSQSIIFCNKLAADLRDARRRIEIGEVSLGETEVAVKAVDQDLEGVLERVEILLLRRDPSPHACSPLLPGGRCADR